MPPIPLNDPTPTIDEVDRHIRSVDPAVFASGQEGWTGSRALPDPAAILGRIRTVYAAFRPVARFASTLVIMPPTWRTFFAGFVGAMDALVGGGE